MASPAFATFGERMHEVRRLLTLCTQDDADWRIRKERAPTDGAILRGALVLLCSHIEGYFEDLVCDTVAAYDQLADRASQLPDDLCAYQVLGSPALWDVKDPHRRWATVQSWAKHPLLDASRRKEQGILDADLHTKGFANPGTGEISDLFKTVGIPDIWETFHSLEADQVFRQSIDVIVNRRNQIAHGKLDAAVTLSDVEMYVVRVERTATVFNEIVTTKIQAQLGINDCWSTVHR